MTIIRNGNRHLIHPDSVNRPGIYAIANLISERVYIGSSALLRDRLTSHIWHLRKGKHGNRHLQASWDKHGEDSFIFCSLEYIDDASKLETIEQEWIEKHTGMLFNMQGATAIKRGGYHHTEESRKLISINSRKNWQKPEYRAAIVGAIRGLKRPRESVERMAASKRGKKMSEKARENMRLERATRPPLPTRTAEHNAKIAATKTKSYVVTSPELVEMKIKNLREFCRNNGLNQAHMVKVAKGKYSNHKGWKCRYATDEDINKE